MDLPDSKPVEKINQSAEAEVLRLDSLLFFEERGQNCRV